MKKIIVYGTETCPYCVHAKEFLDKHKIEYGYFSVDKDEKAAHEMIEKSGQTGVPVIDIDGTIIIGFDEPKIKELLKI